MLFNSIVRRNFGKGDADAVAKAIIQDDSRENATQQAKDTIGSDARLIDTHGAYLILPKT